MKVETFLPSYPEIDKDLNPLFNLYPDENFNQVIFRKKEFYDLKLTDVQEDGGYEHQQIITRFLASYTLYNELLLFWYPGTGKSCGVISVIENIIHKPNTTIKRAFIIVPNETLVNRFQNEIIFTCTNKTYFPEDEKIDTELNELELRQKRFRQGKKIIKPFYHVTTHEKFYTSISQNSQHWRQRYSNSIIVLDEAHHISNNDRWYPVFNDFLHSLENRKILLLSGTPMINNSFEIAPMMNLILPSGMALPTGNDFIKEYIDQEGFVKENKEKVLSEIFRGRISYLKSNINIKYEFQGNFNDDEIRFPMYPSIMSNHQEKYYKLAIADSDNKGENDETFYNNSLQASLFVYPDGSFGITGSTTFLNKKQYPNFLNEIRKIKNTEDKLTELEKYSAKYANAIRIIVNNKDQNCFVYTSSIQGSGAIIFGLCLELFGYAKGFKNNSSSPGLRYSILSDRVDQHTKEVIDIFNHRKNSTGGYIQVLIGGKKIQEGVTFYSIRQIHVLTPLWNFSGLDQVLARGIRMNAHRYIAQDNPIVLIYLHIAMPQTNIMSVDLKLYKISQSKDIGIKSVEYIIKKSAFDCALTYNRNVDVSGTNKIRECEYKNCDYKCDGVTVPYILGERDLDKSTYQLNFEYLYKNDIVRTLQKVFKLQFSITFRELINYYRDYYSEYQLYIILYSIVDSSFVFINKYGIPSYLHVEHDIFFLSDNYSSKSLLSSYYNEYPVLSENVKFMDLLKDISSSTHVLDSLVDMSASDLQDRIPILPLHIQEQFIETALTAKNRTLMTDWVLGYYAEYITEEKAMSGEEYFSSFLDPVIRRYTRKTGWKDYVARAPTVKIRNINKGVFAKYKGPKKIFSIVDVRDVLDDKEEFDKQLSKRGKACSSFSFEDMNKIIFHLDITSDNNTLNIVDATSILDKLNMSTEGLDEHQIINIAYWGQKNKTELCGELEQWFKNNNLFV
jgi:hypothetical protein